MAAWGCHQRFVLCVFLVTAVAIPLDGPVSGQRSHAGRSRPASSTSSAVSRDSQQQLLVRYLLSRLITPPATLRPPSPLAPTTPIPPTQRKLPLPPPVPRARKITPPRLYLQHNQKQPEPEYDDQDQDDHYQEYDYDEDRPPDEEEEEDSGGGHHQPDDDPSSTPSIWDKIWVRDRNRPRHLPRTLPGLNRLLGEIQQELDANASRIQHHQGDERKLQEEEVWRWRGGWEEDEAVLQGNSWGVPRGRDHDRDPQSGHETQDAYHVVFPPFSFDDNSGCANCIDDGSSSAAAKWTMPFVKLGDKRYYLGIFFKANWFKGAQYCRYHGMHLASVESQEENERLNKYIQDFGLGHEHFWTSGTDLAEEGSFFWMATGRPLTYTNWNAGEPNNFRYENGEEENCLELWNRDGKGLKWNDSPCSFETFFICEIV